MQAFQLDPEVKFPLLREKAPVLGNSELWASPWTYPCFFLSNLQHQKVPGSPEASGSKRKQDKEEKAEEKR